jgi:hypothetical protein
MSGRRIIWNIYTFEMTFFSKIYKRCSKIFSGGNTYKQMNMKKSNAG